MTSRTPTITGAEWAYSYERLQSTQLFFLFTGNAEQLNINPVDFVQKTGISDRNLVILRDPYHASYQRGVSEECSSLDHLAEWLREQLVDRFAHVQEVFCAGTSGGGPAAIHVAHRLDARAAWSLSGRTARIGLTEERRRFAAGFYQKVLGRPTPGVLTDAEQACVLAAFEDPEMSRLRWNLTGNPDTVIDAGQLSRLVCLLREQPTTTAFHFYYVETNAIDRAFAEAFRDNAHVTIHRIAASRAPGPRVRFADPDHAIVPILDELGLLGSLFSDEL